MNGATARRWRYATGARSGQALVEFALVFPIIILLMLAGIDLGRAVFVYSSVTNAAREGARMAIVNQDATAITTRATQQTTLVGATDPNLTALYYMPKANGDPDLAKPCGSPVAVDCLAVVTYEATYTPLTPVISSILFKNGVALQATSVLSVEFTCPNATTPANKCPKQP